MKDNSFTSKTKHAILQHAQRETCSSRARPGVGQDFKACRHSCSVGPNSRFAQSCWCRPIGHFEPRDEVLGTTLSIDPTAIGSVTEPVCYGTIDPEGRPPANIRDRMVGPYPPPPSPPQPPWRVCPTTARCQHGRTVFRFLHVGRSQLRTTFAELLRGQRRDQRRSGSRHFSTRTDPAIRWRLF